MQYFLSEYYSLHINCGDEEVNINKTKYEADTLRRHAFHNEGNWAFSSTGNFLDGDRESELYTLSNTSNLHISTEDVKLYQKARTSSIMLTYYGLCLMNGLYTVKLHFAEIVFTDDNSFNSLGKRVFDVYVQVGDSSFEYNRVTAQRCDQLLHDFYLRLPTLNMKDFCN
ncbi:putative Malectin domain-containing protein [Helianthus annuus]|nr:putative Malectin domain-containing protein [Helianthus annuus]